MADEIGTSKLDQAGSDSAAAGDAVPEDAQNVAVLKEQINALKNKCCKLFKETKRIGLELMHEKQKVAELERQVQLSKDNHKIVERLHRALLLKLKNRKFDKPSIVEIYDKGVQTWDGILCRACLDTEKIRAELQHLQETHRNSILMKPEQFEKIRMSVELIKKIAFTKYDDVKLPNNIKSHVQTNVRKFFDGTQRVIPNEKILTVRKSASARGSVTMEQRKTHFLGTPKHYSRSYVNV